jgi:hypothetical protein
MSKIGIFLAWRDPEGTVRDRRLTATASEPFGEVARIKN